MLYLGYSCKYLAFTQYFSSSHKAVDIPKIVTVGNIKKTNDYVYMAYDGKIVKNAYASDYGWYVEYEVKDGNDTYLLASGHFDKKSSLEVGKTYKRLTVINPIGKSGTNSTGYHDHFRVTKNGVRVNPLDYCYAYTDWNVIGTKETANIKKYTPSTDYKELYEEELAKNQKLELENKDLQAQLDKSNKKLEDIKIIVNS